MLLMTLNVTYYASLTRWFSRAETAGQCTKPPRLAHHVFITLTRVGAGFKIELE